MLAAPQIIGGHSTVRPWLVPEFTGWSSSSLRREGESLASLLVSTLYPWSCYLSKTFGKTRSTGKQQRAERNRLILLSTIQHPLPPRYIHSHMTSRSCLRFPISCSLPSECPISPQPVNLKPLHKLLFIQVMNRQNFQSVTESMPAKTLSESLNPPKEKLVSFFSLSKPQSRAGPVEWGYSWESRMQGANTCWVWKWRQSLQALCSQLKQKVLWHPSNET